MSGPAGSWARFDDMRSGRALAFTGPFRELVARHPDEVRPVLAEVARRTAAGEWAAGFVAYEAAPGLDAALRTHPPQEGLPLVWFGIGPAPVEVDPVALPPAGPGWRWTPRWDADRHARAVQAVRERIAAGDTYQVNLTMRLEAPIAEHPRRLYARLAHAQRGAHHAFLDTGRFAIAGASPELFFELRGDHVLMRPMKGTARRGRTTAEDAEIVAALRASSKERAENIMIVDLVRNDLARIARTGTVRVPALVRPEKYETVHQLTSDVEARLLPGAGLVDVFEALFPCGSVTGAPKAATMDIIAELEDLPRGVYCGAVGFVAPPTAPVQARFSVAIRTVVADRLRDHAVYGSGGGITWSSDPAAEHAEVLAKAAVLDVQPEDVHLIETLRYEPGRGPLRLQLHLERMADSAAYLGFPFDVDAARAAVADAVQGSTDDARVRITAHRDGAVRVAVGPAPDPGPARVVVDPEPISSRSRWPYHKTSRRGPFEERLARHPAVDDVLLVNERGELTESCTANLAVLLEGRWWTPPLSSGCLPGVARRVLLEAGVLAERVVRPADLERASAVALVNSLRGWRPVVVVPVEEAAASGVASAAR
ncbi:para-aminobenzoate synthetase / 4-amino-4-deoxychorismate lyase [Pseudonocardia thermophila]|uniref:Para-aminobenzoate synthetase / 4-amino-4-deoxychorismate lyase n=1 Tax=Pseudonocardia thermophila TaxID=1848 RepID=A0A1M6SY04_PSETH|nr:chorismate-binding protein [Pseudonocardia thermophila]SHK49530.1 para-aminobenzoate synthetase / 4-amino-4-deoxychorismate lyase [Pseudonocardia thermophila]